MTALVTAVACAAFDDVTDTAVLAVREVVARTGVRLPTRPRHRPHVTLAAVRVHPDQLDAVAAQVRAAVDGAAAFAVDLDRVGGFSRAGALWLGPAAAADLSTLQQSVHRVFGAGPWPTAFDGRSEPATWVPHVTLATRLDRAALDRAQAAVRARYDPVRATVAGVALVVVGGAGDAGLVPFGDARPSVWPAPAVASK